MKEEVLVDVHKLTRSVIATLNKIKKDAEGDIESDLQKYACLYQNLIGACDGNLFVVETILEQVKEEMIDESDMKSIELHQYLDSLLNQ